MVATNSSSLSLISPDIPFSEQQFGLLLITGVKRKGRYVFAYGTCACGKTWEGRLSSLIHGSTQSCGCQARNAKKDLSTKTFGQVTVLSMVWRESGGRNCGFATVQCICGKIWETRSSSLLQGDVKSCGACTGDQKYLGQQYGALTIIEAIYRNGGVHFHCQCICGNTWEGSGGQILRGDVQSCGCQQGKPRIDRTGQTFEKLTVVQMEWRNGRGYAFAVCECGTPWEGMVGRLVSGSTRSCGCLAPHPNGKAWYSTPEQKRELARLYAQRRRTRLRNLPYSFEIEDVVFMLNYWANACAICHRQEGFFHRIAYDHWIPIVAAHCPGTISSNMLPLCHAKKGTQGSNLGCNNSKGSKPPTLWLIEKLGPRRAKAKLREIQNYFSLIQARKDSRDPSSL
jgi:hypothetical protein